MNRAPTVGSLFSGIGGFDIGLERAGMRIAWQSEIDPYACAVLRRHWPHVPNLGDVRTVTADRAERVDVVCGGFPCQDISNAGKRAGIDGERSGLWSEYVRVIRELRPRFVLVENVSALLGRGLGRVLGDLAALGFDAEWHCIPASAVGAPHRRDRVWIVADSDPYRCQGLRSGRNIGAPNGACEGGAPAGALRAAAPFADILGRELSQRGPDGRMGRREWFPRDADWQGAPEPFIRRIDHGFSSRVDRLRCLGNAIVPQIAEIIGRAVMEGFE